jgi:hypothetical protein
VDFRRKVLQTISSTPFVKLQNGTYKVSAKVKSSSGFSRLEM